MYMYLFLHASYSTRMHACTYNYLQMYVYISRPRADLGTHGHLSIIGVNFTFFIIFPLLSVIAEQ